MTQVSGEDEQKLMDLCIRAQRVQNSDEMVVTKAKKMGKELFAELQPDARKKMLDSIVCRYLLNDVLGSIICNH